MEFYRDLSGASSKLYRAIVILQELKREQPLVLIKLLQTSALAAASRAESPTPARATAPVERSEALG